ncbi:hypothetical protein [Psychroserpens burtonensis]|uniref:hypothetical protein n=1 Tax=Psychroserpens burtonensis TaxID=49278 RepID=UPI00040FCF85|nr:hypothetical protein [Psychroserpens burtonensis]
MIKNDCLKFSQIKYTLLLLCVFSFFNAKSQNQDKLSASYSNYAKLPREIAYAHLNKSLYLKEETIGFSVYVFDKSSKNHSDVTTNVYCSIANSKGRVLNKALILAENGVANGSFLIDSTYASGSYTFKAYTNWMKNFDEQNFYLQNIKIINTDDENDVSTTMDAPVLDTQFLPEGGHLISNIKNVVGVIIKDDNGYGLREADGTIKDSNGELITTFKTNQFGIGKFIFTPSEGKDYTAEITYDELTSQVNIKPAERTGLNLSLNNLGSKIALTFRSNANTLQNIKDKNFRIIIHNGSLIKSLDFSFTDTQEITKLINISDLYSGINIITLFDEDNNPILERLFFNYDGISILNSEKASTTKSFDSITISVPFNSIDASQFHNLSVSVLPSGTSSYDTNHNIVSYTYLQPYVKSYIENARYYFTAIDRKKKFELDNLLLTQGWSSYEWNSIFNYEPNVKFDFEKGITVNANINNSKSNQFIMYPMINSSTQTIEVPKKEKSFTIKGLLPVDDEKVIFGSIGKKQDVEKPSLYLQFTPSSIPTIDNFIKILPLKVKSIYDSKIKEPIYKNSISDAQELDLVVINAQKTRTKIDQIKRRQPAGRVDVFDENARNRYIDFASYIGVQGFNVTQSAVTLSITTQRRNTLSGNLTPLIYLDKMMLSDFSVLLNLNMRNVDYIVVDKSGFGEGLRGSAGVIKIFTDPNIQFESDYSKNVSQEAKIPLTFTSPKKFYTPLYSSYRSAFFNQYGVIGWIPDGKLDNNGNLIFKIADKNIEQIKLFIEGTANQGSFISEEKIITFN